jgi:hypothetical protein
LFGRGQKATPNPMFYHRSGRFWPLFYCSLLRLQQRVCRPWTAYCAYNHITTLSVYFIIVYNKSDLVSQCIFSSLQIRILLFRTNSFYRLILTLRHLEIIFLITYLYCLWLIFP